MPSTSVFLCSTWVFPGQMSEVWALLRQQKGLELNHRPVRSRSSVIFSARHSSLDLPGQIDVPRVYPTGCRITRPPDVWCDSQALSKDSWRAERLQKKRRSYREQPVFHNMYLTQRKIRNVTAPPVLLGYLTVKKENQNKAVHLSGLGMREMNHDGLLLSCKRRRGPSSSWKVKDSSLTRKFKRVRGKKGQLGGIRMAGPHRAKWITNGWRDRAWRALRSPVPSASTCHPSNFQLILGDSGPTPGTGAKERAQGRDSTSRLRQRSRDVTTPCQWSRECSAAALIHIEGQRWACLFG